MEHNNGEVTAGAGDKQRLRSQSGCEENEKTFREIQIRPVSSEDLHDIADLEALVFPVPWSEKLYKETFDSGLYLMLAMTKTVQAPDVQNKPETLIGYLCGQIIMDEAELDRIAVAPSFRGRGYGRALLDEFISEAAAAGARHIFLEVRQSNQAAAGLYLSSGFRQTGRRKRYYRHPVEDALILEKDLVT